MLLGGYAVGVAVRATATTVESKNQARWQTVKVYSVIYNVTTPTATTLRLQWRHSAKRQPKPIPNTQREREGKLKTCRYYGR